MNTAAADPAGGGTAARWLTPVIAGLTVAAGSTALTGVLSGPRVWWTVAVATGLVTAVGLGARAARAPWWAVVLAQLGALVLAMTAMFTQGAVLGVLPGAEAVAELIGHLGAVGGQIEGALPPVPATTALLVLVALALGLLTTLVDALAAAGFGPAACGLVLLCTYTVPTTLARDALPDWTLAVGAASYGLLLVVDHLRRHPHPAGAGQADPALGGGHAARVSSGPDGGSPGPVAALVRLSRLLAGIAPTVAVTALAVAFALLVGGLVTAVGTEGRFPGNAAERNGKQGSQFGLNPFTSLRGQLEQPDPEELLRVRGLPPATYLRALTLTDYVPSAGWQLPSRRREVTLDRTLPTGLPTPPTGGTVTVEVENLGYRDRWLPMAGLPLGVTGVVPGRWRYDPLTTTAYTDGPVIERAWVQRAALLSPGPEVLGALPPTVDVDPAYLDTNGVDPRIRRLAGALTSRAGTQFAKVVALNRYFLDPANGFQYSLRTAPGNTGDALLDFLTRGKVGYCEQFASAMAIMLRAVGVPARVAIGFTPGSDIAGARTITTTDAHAWVEVLFPGQGWLTFDPTPLGDSRAVTPGYLAQAPEVPVTPPPPELLAPPEPEPGRPELAPPPPPLPVPGQAADGAPRPDPGSGSESSQAPVPATPGGPDEGQPGGAPPEDPRRVAALLGLVIGVVVTAMLAAPSTARRWVRRRRMARAARGGAGGASAAWREVLAESRDHGGAPPGNSSVRAAARRLVVAHRLDPEVDVAVRAVVGAIERSWYAPLPDHESGPTLVAALQRIHTGFERVSPLGIGDRLWPRSVRPRWAAPGSPTDPASDPAAGRAGGQAPVARHARSAARTRTPAG